MAVVTVVRIMRWWLCPHCGARVLHNKQLSDERLRRHTRGWPHFCTSNTGKALAVAELVPMTEHAFYVAELV